MATPNGDGQFDPVALVRDMLAERLPTVNVRTVLPDNLDAILPAVQLVLLPGTHESLPWNGTEYLRFSPRFDIACLAGNYGTALTIALDIATTALPALRNQGNQWGRVSHVFDVVGPDDRPDFNPRTRRVGVVASVTCHRPA